jgi:hypothetical protein
VPFGASGNLGYDCPPLPILLVLIHPSAWNRRSQKFISTILHSTVPIPLESPTPGTLHRTVPAELVTPMDRYARWWMFSLQTFATPSSALANARMRHMVMCPYPLYANVVACLSSGPTRTVREVLCVVRGRSARREGGKL